MPISFAAPCVLAALLLLPCGGDAPPTDTDGAPHALLPGSGTDAHCDGVDEDGDGLLDEDWVPTETACGIGACTANGHLVCIDGRLADDCLADDPLYEDDNEDGVDDDCDGSVDESFVAP